MKSANPYWSWISQTFNIPFGNSILFLSLNMVSCDKKTHKFQFKSHFFIEILSNQHKRLLNASHITIHCWTVERGLFPNVRVLNKENLHKIHLKSHSSNNLLFIFLFTINRTDSFVTFFGFFKKTTHFFLLINSKSVDKLAATVHYNIWHINLTNEICINANKSNNSSSNGHLRWISFK